MSAIARDSTPAEDHAAYARRLIARMFKRPRRTSATTVGLRGVAADWVQQNLADFFAGLPTVTTGSVWLHEVGGELSSTPAP
jgi:hypothetical protein